MFLLLLFFRPDWTVIDRLDTRQQILIRDSIISPTISCSRTKCSVMKGLWYCPYTNRLIQKPKEIDIDHIVPLKEAFESGANRWTRERFIKFANDHENLLAVSAQANRAKGDKEPGRWPTRNVRLNDPYWCDTYEKQYLQIKTKYDLTTDSLDSCLAR